MPPLFLRRRLREGRLKRDVAPLDGLGVGPGDLPRRRRVRPRAGRGIGPEVVVGRRGRQAEGKNCSVRPQTRYRRQLSITLAETRLLAQGYTSKRRSERRARCWSER